MADLTTFMPVRKQPVGPRRDVQRQRGGRDRRPRDRRPRTPPACSCASRAARAASRRSRRSAPGARTTCTGRSTAREASAAWRAERPEELWLGHRDRPNELLLRDPGQLAPHAASHTSMPAGHAEGFGETFRELYRAVYSAVAAGRAAGPARLPDLRRRPRAGADRRRDRALARGGPVGRGDRSSWRHLRLRRDAGRLRAARRGGLAARAGALRLRGHRRGPRGLRRHPVRAHARVPGRARAAMPDAAALWPEISGELFALIDAQLEPFEDALAGGRARCASAGVRDRGRLLDACASGWTARWPAPACRSRSRSRATRSSTASPRRTCSCSRRAARRRAGRCVVIEDSPPGVAAGQRGGHADARRPPRPRHDLSRRDRVVEHDHAPTPSLDYGLARRGHARTDPLRRRLLARADRAGQRLLLETASGRRVLDFTAGQICATIGHNHPRVAGRVRRALDDVIHLNSWMLSPPVLELADALLATLPPRWRARSSSPPAASRSRSPSGWRSCTPAAFEVASLTRSWHGLTGGAAALTTDRRAARLRPDLPGGFALPAPYAYRCPIRHCDGDVRLHLPGGGLRPLRPGLGRRARGRRGRAGALGGRRDRPAARLLRAAARALRRARDAARSSTSARPASAGSGRCTASRSTGRAGLPRAVQDARRRHPDRRRGDERDDRGGLPRARVHARDLARLRPAAGGRRAGGARRRARRGPARPRAARRRAAAGRTCASCRTATS